MLGASEMPFWVAWHRKICIWYQCRGRNSEATSSTHPEAFQVTTSFQATLQKTFQITMKRDRCEIKTMVAGIYRNFNLIISYFFFAIMEGNLFSSPNSLLYGLC